MGTPIEIKRIPFTNINGAGALIAYAIKADLSDSSIASAIRLCKEGVPAVASYAEWKRHTSFVPGAKIAISCYARAIWLEHICIASTES